LNSSVYWLATEITPRPILSDTHYMSKSIRGLNRVKVALMKQVSPENLFQSERK
jgi:hypothetical protein